MAAQQPNPSAYAPEDRNFMRMVIIHGKVVTKVLYFVFERGTFGRPHNISLLEFYERKGVVINRFKRIVFANQLEKIKNDPEGKTFDVTLLYRCLRSGGHGLADEDDAKWKEGNDSIESLMTTVKNKRNNMAHEEQTRTEKQLLDETDELRVLLTRILKFTEAHYNIPSDIVKREIDDMEANIRKYMDDDFMPKSFDEYEKQVVFPEQSEYVNHEGKKEVNQQYDKMNETEVSPVTHMKGITFPVKEIFTEMKLKMESDEETITYDEVLREVSQNKTDSVILIEGRAGAGKTALTKKILSDWMLNNSTMKDLDTYDLLLYSQCRNPTIGSFTELLQHLMPETARKFKMDHFKFITLDQKILIIIDGLDELNDKSKSLFEEVLILKKSHRIKVMVTTRPEKLTYFSTYVNSLSLETKHIQLLGIPQEKRDSFVIKYHEKMSKENSSIPAIDELRKYLKRTEYRLSHLWELPYNLILLILIWVHEFRKLHEINTSPALYWQIHMMYQLKLLGRLLTNQDTHTQESILEEITDSFISKLSKEALVGLINDNLSLTEKSYKELRSFCSKNNVPLEEMIGAFLITTVTETILGPKKTYTFPHKGIQEFYAALYIFREMESETQSCHGMESSSSGATSTQEITFVQSILEELQGSVLLNIEKYQNLFSILIGLFHLESDRIKDSFKEEVLKLLKKTGIEDSKDWLRILDSVKCDRFVATFITQQQPDILQGDLVISDSTLYAYISLLEALQPSRESSHEGRIYIQIQGDISGLDKLMKQINDHKLKVKEILINDNNFLEYTSLLEALPPPLKDAREVTIEVRVNERASDVTELMNVISRNQFKIQIYIQYDFRHPTPNLMLEGALNQVFQKCTLERYKGSLGSSMCIPQTIRYLYVSVAERTCFSPLNQFFQSKPYLDGLGVSLSHKLASSMINCPLPDTAQHGQSPSLFIPDVKTSSEIQKAAEIIKKLQPINGRKKFYEIYFPRATLTHRGVKELIGRMKGIVLWSLIFPSSCKPSSPQEEQQIQKLAKTILKCMGNVEWGYHDIDEW